MVVYQQRTSVHKHTLMSFHSHIRHSLPALMEPFLASRRRPFFFKMKLPPMKMLELIANPRPM